MKQILILPNPFKPEAMQLTGILVRLLEERGLVAVLEEQIATQLGLVDLGRPKASLWEEIDLVMVLGGDGSMLNAAQRVYPREIPLLGVNLGHLGFLTRIESNQLEESLDLLRDGQFELENRTMLEARIMRGQNELAIMVALNELVVTRNTFATMVRLGTWIDGEFFTTYPVDGLIVATATGSTAYSLSAGGPILDPRTKMILLTPICAHSLYARPLVLSENAQIKVAMDAGHAEVAVTADGQRGFPLKPGDEINFQRAQRVTRLLRFNNQGLFQVLRSRLNEG